MKDSQKLLDLFSNKTIQIRNTEIGSFTDAPFQPERLPFRYVDLSRISDKAEFLAKMLKSIAYCCKNLPQKDDDLDSSEVGYLFPDDSFLKNHLENIDDTTLDETTFEKLKFTVVNITKEKVDSFLFNFVDDVTDSQKDPTSNNLRFIVGKKGVGKTTFVNYLVRKYRNQLRKNKIIVNVLSYDTLREVFTEENKGVNWKDLIIENIMSSIVCEILNLISIGKIRKTIFSHFDDYKKYLQLDPEIEKNITLEKKFLSLIQKINQNRGPISVIYVKKMDPTIKKFFIEKYSKDFKYLLILDGLDQLSFSAVATGVFKKFFREIQKIVIQETGLEDLENIKINYIVTLRRCTFVPFVNAKRKNNRELDHLKLYLAPSSSIKVIERGVRMFCRSKKNKERLIQHEPQLLRFVNKLHLLICHTLKIDGDLAEYFGYNYREMIQYFLNVFTYICEISLEQHLSKRNKHNSKVGQVQQLTSFLNYLFSQRNIDFILSKSYRLLHILVLGNKDYFSNHFGFEYTQEADIEALDHKAENWKRGHFDNLFNYHLFEEDFEQNKIHPILVKVRILQYCNEYRTSKSIQNFLHEIGYTIHNVMKTLEILIHSNYLKTCGNRNGGIGIFYQVTKKAHYAIENLCVSLPYLENVIQAIVFPIEMRRLVQYPSRINLNQWVTGGIINVHLIYSLIRYVESLERMHGRKNSISIDDYLISDKILKNLKHDIKHIIFGDELHFNLKLDLSKITQTISENTDILTSGS